MVRTMPQKKHRVAYLLPWSGYSVANDSTDLIAKISTNDTYSITPAETPRAPARALVLA